MAKRKGSSKRPQPKHKKQKKSQHDKRTRLQTPNPDRKRTTKAKVPLTGAMQTAVSVLQADGSQDRLSASNHRGWDVAG